MPVSKAIRQSTSIPFIFKTTQNNLGDTIIDGGMGDIYPINKFDVGNRYNKKTLGLKIMSPLWEKRNDIIRERLGHPIDSLVDFIGAFLLFQSLVIER